MVLVVLVLALLVVLLMQMTGIKSPRLMIIRDGNILKLLNINPRWVLPVPLSRANCVSPVSVIGRPECYQEIHLAVLNIPEYSDTPTVSLVAQFYKFARQDDQR